ncbi:MAG: hypothetical protein CVU54_01975 [Deltaproteobacteria bacterium HGW-Deltaproteobacteria-12]|jgi:hypothetical protein|nr:MAG: hypothetical protein CVU54_01975 [Deltaproteobacteria bacterium HGW-Deltaproteobacteria-12]
MTPDQVAALTSVAAIISQLGTWPIGSVIAAIIFGPWIVLIMTSRSMEKRHEAAMKMYQNNVKLVEGYEIIAAQQADTIRLSIAATTELTTYLKTKTPCHQLVKIGKFQ